MLTDVEELAGVAPASVELAPELDPAAGLVCPAVVSVGGAAVEVPVLVFCPCVGGVVSLLVEVSGTLVDVVVSLDDVGGAAVVDVVDELVSEDAVAGVEAAAAEEELGSAVGEEFSEVLEEDGSGPVFELAGADEDEEEAEDIAEDGSEACDDGDDEEAAGVADGELVGDADMKGRDDNEKWAEKSAGNPLDHARLVCHVIAGVGGRLVQRQSLTNRGSGRGQDALAVDNKACAASRTHSDVVCKDKNM